MGQKFERLSIMIAEVKPPIMASLNRALPSDFRNDAISSHMMFLVENAREVISEVNTVTSQTSSSKGDTTITDGKQASSTPALEEPVVDEATRKENVGQWLIKTNGQENTSSNSLIDSSYIIPEQSLVVETLEITGAPQFVSSNHLMRGNTKEHPDSGYEFV